MNPELIRLPITGLLIVALIFALIGAAGESPRMAAWKKWPLAILLFPLGIAGAVGVSFGVIALWQLPLGTSMGDGQALGAAANEWLITLSLALGCVAAYLIFSYVAHWCFRKFGGEEEVATEGGAPAE